jgi:hypothetical protein
MRNHVEMWDRLAAAALGRDGRHLRQTAFTCSSYCWNLLAIRSQYSASCPPADQGRQSRIPCGWQNFAGHRLAGIGIDAGSASPQAKRLGQINHSSPVVSPAALEARDHPILMRATDAPYAPSPRRKFGAVASTGKGDHIRLVRYWENLVILFQLVIAEPR